MKTMFEGAEIGVPCPKCRHEIEKKIAWLRTHDEITCPACGETFGVESKKLIAGIEQAQKSTDTFRRKMSRIGKR